MRCSVFGLALIPLVICGSIFAAEAQSPTEPDASQKAQKLPSANPARAAKSSKQIPKTQSRSAPPPLPLSSAETYAAQHSADLPVSSAAKSPSPATNSWTGFYIGAGAGVGRE
jgi:hypothetical protein